MKDKIISFLDSGIYWLIVIFPFSIAVAQAPIEIISGFLIVFFLISKILKKQSPFKKTALNLPLLLFFAITCLSIVHSVSLIDTLKGGIFKLLRYTLLFFIIAEELRDKRHLKRIVILVMLGIILVSTDAILQVFSGRDFIRGYSPVFNIGLIRATASFKDSNTFGIYLSAFAPVIFGIALYYSKIQKKILFSLVSLLALVAIVLTYSRPTLLAAYIALLFLGVTEKKKALIIILVALIFVTPFVLPVSVKKWIKTCNYNPLRMMCNDDRIAIFRNSINMIKAHPFIGLGANTYMKNYKNYKEKPEWRNVVTSDYVYAHNNFLHMAAEIGLIGLGIFIWIIYKVFLSCRRIYKRLNSDGYLRAASLSLSACLLAFLINGLTESSLYYSRVGIIFWFILGLSFSLGKLGKT